MICNHLLQDFREFIARS